jgi:UDP-N-acetylglucosamine transferase subunit ALG13
MATNVGTLQKSNLFGFNLLVFQMILVLLGTYPISFSRPLIALEEILEKKIITEEVIVQSGHTQFVSKHMKIIPFIPLDDLLKIYEKADLIITQGGTGSVIKALKLRKRVIGIPRLYKNQEAVDDHQLELIEEMSKAGYLIPWYENDELKDLLEKAKNFIPSKFESNNQKIIDYLANYINQN